MKIGDKGYAVLPEYQLYRIESVTIIGENEIDFKEEKFKYWEVRYNETYGIGAMPKDRVFKTKKEAEAYRRQIIEKEHMEFVSRVSDKESFFKYLYDKATTDTFNYLDDKYIAEKIKEYTGVDVLKKKCI